MRQKKRNLGWLSLVAFLLAVIAITVSTHETLFGVVSGPSILVVKEVSVDGGQTYDAYPDLNAPVQIQFGKQNG